MGEAEEKVLFEVEIVGIVTTVYKFQGNGLISACSSCIYVEHMRLMCQTRTKEVQIPAQP